MVELLEKHGRGLNLTWEVRDGILNHKTSGHPATLEGAIVRLSDKIAYINHDIDDAIRGGILKPEDIPSEFRMVLGETTRMRLNTMIHNVIRSSENQQVITMSGEVERATQGLRKFMFEHVYLNPRAKREEHKAEEMIQNLYGYYIDHIEQLPEKYLEMIDRGVSTKEQSVCDFIAVMTDAYAVKKFREYFIPEGWEE